MGNFAIHIEAVGNHGCQRDKAEITEPCDNPRCPDCAAREFVRKLRDDGSSVTDATLTHWPGTTSEVREDLRTGFREGEGFNA